MGGTNKQHTWFLLIVLCRFFHSGEHHLGYEESDVRGKSWYEYVHPEDLTEAQEKHSQRTCSTLMIIILQ